MFGLLRAAEFTVTDVSGFHPDINMTLSDVSFSHDDSSSNFMTIHLKRTKTCRNNYLMFRLAMMILVVIL